MCSTEYVETLCNNLNGVVIHKNIKSICVEWLSPELIIKNIFFPLPIKKHLMGKMAPHSSTVARKIPWTEEPGRLQSMGSHRVGHD